MNLMDYYLAGGVSNTIVGKQIKSIKSGIIMGEVEGFGINESGDYLKLKGLGTIHHASFNYYEIID